jgi:hypothetical protein
MIECGGGFVTFGQQSINTIEEIRRKRKLGTLLQALNATSVLYSIFVKNNSLTSSFYVTQQDFFMFSKAAKGTGDLVRNLIYRDIEMLILTTGLQGEERAFWMCMKDSLR